MLDAPAAGPRSCRRRTRSLGLDSRPRRRHGAGENALGVIDGISQKYIGATVPMRSGTVYEIEAERSGFVELPFHDPRS